MSGFAVGNNMLVQRKPQAHGVDVIAEIKSKLSSDCDLTTVFRNLLTTYSHDARNNTPGRMHSKELVEIGIGLVKIKNNSEAKNSLNSLENPVLLKPFLKIISLYDGRDPEESTQITNKGQALLAIGNYTTEQNLIIQDISIHGRGDSPNRNISRGHFLSIQTQDSLNNSVVTMVDISRNPNSTLLKRVSDGSVFENKGLFNPIANGEWQLMTGPINTDIKLTITGNKKSERVTEIDFEILSSQQSAEYSRVGLLFSVGGSSSAAVGAPLASSAGGVPLIGGHNIPFFQDK